MKRLLPSLKEKKHYLVILAEKKEIEEAIFKFLGINGYSKASISFIGTSRGKTILAANTKSVNDVKMALLSAGIKCIGVSGTIKKAKEKFLK